MKKDKQKSKKEETNEMIERLENSLFEAKEEQRKMAVFEANRVLSGTCLKRREGVYGEITKVLNVDIDNNKIVFYSDHLSFIHNKNVDITDYNEDLADEIDLNSIQSEIVSNEEYHNKLNELLDYIIKK